MSAAKPLFDDPPDVIQFPSLYVPGSPPSAPRIQNPGGAMLRPVARRRHRPADDQESLWPTACDPDVQAVAEQVEQEFRDPVVPAESRLWLRKNLSLRQFYEDWMLPDRLQRVAKGKLSRGSLEKDRQALNRWERYSRPEDWSAERAWPGLPIGSVTNLYMGSVLERMEAGLDQATVASTWNHLRTIFNYAVRVRALDIAPKPERSKPEDKRVVIYSDEQIAAAYYALRDHVALQVSFVLSINVGARTEDIFGIRTEGLSLVGARPTVTFWADKTRKWQTVPLAPVTVSHLRRLPLGSSPFLFAGLSSPECKDPGGSHAARERRAMIRILFGRAGITFPRPYQVGRKTCNTRLNTIRPGAGDFVLGHSLGLNTKSYMEPNELIFQAVDAVPQPPCFSDF